MKRTLLLFVLLICAAARSQIEGYANNTDATKTYYRIFGVGKPLLIINGGPGMNSDGFELLAKRLATTRQVILYDQRGTGKSALQKITPETVSMQLMAKDIESLRKHLNIDQWDVLGHSFGGMLASYYASLYPHPMRRLILSASGGIDLGLLSYVQQSMQEKLTKTERDSLAYWNAKIERGDTSRSARLGRGRNLAPAYLYDKKHVPVLTHRLTQGNALLNTIIWNDMRNIDFNCAPQLKNYDKPVLIIQGKQDIIKVATADIAQKAFVNSTIVLLEKCGHYGWLDAPTDYFAAIDSFLVEQ